LQVAAIFKIANSKEIPEIPDSFSEEGKSFLQMCLKRDPASRFTATQLMDHPFVQDHPAVRAAKSGALRNAFAPADGTHTTSNREFSRKSITPLKDIGVSARDFTGFSTAVPSPHTARYCDSCIYPHFVLSFNLLMLMYYPTAVLFPL
jgi:mitogen-activated protein kinase kinase kinase 3